MPGPMNAAISTKVAMLFINFSFLCGAFFSAAVTIRVSLRAAFGSQEVVNLRWVMGILRESLVTLYNVESRQTGSQDERKSRNVRFAT